MSIENSRFSIPFLKDEEIRRRADEFREKYWGITLPIDVELIAERNLKLIIIPLPDLRHLVDTEAFLTGNLREIIYDPRSSDVRTRFSIAHEIGHFVLHKEAIASLRPASYEEWKETQRRMPEVLWGRAEYQAREFAGRLLVPRTLLIMELKSLHPLIQKAQSIAPDLELPVIKELISPKLAKRFFVSDEVIVRRLDVEELSPVQD